MRGYSQPPDDNQTQARPSPPSAHMHHLKSPPSQPDNAGVGPHIPFHEPFNLFLVAVILPPLYHTWNKVSPTAGCCSLFRVPSRHKQGRSKRARLRWRQVLVPKTTLALPLTPSNPLREPTSRQNPRQNPQQRQSPRTHPPQFDISPQSHCVPSGATT